MSDHPKPKEDAGPKTGTERLKVMFGKVAKGFGAIAVLSLVVLLGILGYYTLGDKKESDTPATTASARTNDSASTPAPATVSRKKVFKTADKRGGNWLKVAVPPRETLCMDPVNKLVLQFRDRNASDDDWKSSLSEVSDLGYVRWQSASDQKVEMWYRFDSSKLCDTPPATS